MQSTAMEVEILLITCC